MVPQIRNVEAVVCASTHEAAWLERNLLEQSLPRWNRSVGGQEVPQYVLLDTRPRAPRIVVEHEHRLDRYPGLLRFGPYLGGARVRTAVEALDRILPLAYTGDGLTGGERDLGRVRGVGAGDRGWVVDAVAAVLARHRDAVGRAAAALAELRDEAAAALDYELAGRIRDEAAALAWLTDPQRATVDGAGDAEIAAWAGSVLVEFGLRGGRLVSWRMTRATSADAAMRVEATPTPWASFAERNAVLAAVLATDDTERGEVTATGPHRPVSTSPGQRQLRRRPALPR
jgi:excinuclease ABC subunit C